MAKYTVAKYLLQELLYEIQQTWRCKQRFCFQVNGKQFAGGNPLPVMIAKLKETSNFDQMQAAIETFNQVRLENDFEFTLIEMYVP